MPEHLGPPLPEPLFDRLTLVGLGLIGSSVARAARHLRIARTLVAVDHDEAVVARGRELHLADEVTRDLVAGVSGADLLVLCIPVGACGSVAEAMRGALKPGAIVSDVGSVKAAVIAQVAGVIP